MAKGFRVYVSKTKGGGINLKTFGDRLSSSFRTNSTTSGTDPKNIQLSGDLAVIHDVTQQLDKLGRDFDYNNVSLRLPDDTSDELKNSLEVIIDGYKSNNQDESYYETLKEVLTPYAEELIQSGEVDNWGEFWFNYHNAVGRELDGSLWEVEIFDSVTGTALQDMESGGGILDFILGDGD